MAVSQFRIERGELFRRFDGRAHILIILCATDVFHAKTQRKTQRRKEDPGPASLRKLCAFA
jgi:hypothetical protein